MLLAWLATGSVLWASPALAEDEKTTTHWVDFEAGDVEVTGDLERIELSGGVAVTSGRFRLAGEEFVLERGPRGVEVQGKGKLSLCPCDDAPVSVGFRQAIVAPPTDLVLTGATLRIGNVPVLPLGVLWMRSPRRLGMLPPHISWRAEDGAFLGSGVHVPLEPEDRSGRDFLDVRAGGYVLGGVETRVDLVRRRNTLSARWDHLDETLIDVQGGGIATREDAGYIAWAIDALRGPRALRGTPDLLRAIQRHDRVRLGVGQATPHWVGGIGLRGQLLRGGPLDGAGAVGPYSSVGWSTELGSNGALNGMMGLWSMSHDELGALTVADEHLALTASTLFGPLLLNTEWGETATTVVSAGDDAAAGDARGSLWLSAPLSREFGGGGDPLIHWVEPRLGVQGATAHRRGALVSFLGETSDTMAITGALHNAVGHRYRRGAAELDMEAGWIRSSREDWVPVGLSEGRASGRWGAARFSGALRLDEPEVGVVLGRARIGRLDRPHLDGWVDGSSPSEPLLARWVRTAPGEHSLSNWFEVDGWSVGGGVGVPLPWRMTAVSGATFDVLAEKLVAVDGGVHYRHPCRCLGLSARGGHRVGRDGVDLWVTLDLVP